MFFIIGGPVGLVGGVGVAISAVVGGPLIGFSIGQLMLLFVLVSPTTVPLLLGEIALGSLLIATTKEHSQPVTTGVLVALGFVGTAAFLVVLTELIHPLWGVTASLIGTIGIASYAIHRYELVTLGLVEEATDE